MSRSMEPDTLSYLNEHWRIFVAFVGVVVWLVRMEARTLSNQRGVNYVRDKLQSHIETENPDIAEMKGDIKDLIKCVHKMDGTLDTWLEIRKQERK